MFAMHSLEDLGGRHVFCPPPKKNSLKALFFFKSEFGSIPKNSGLNLWPFFFWGGGQIGGQPWVGEDGVNWPFFCKTINLKIEDIFLNPLTPGGSVIHFTLLGCKLKMMG